MKERRAVSKVAGVKVYLRQTWNFRSHAVSACISLWHHWPMHAPHRLMHACTACITPWCHRRMHAVTAWALLFWFCPGYTFISSYFGSVKLLMLIKMEITFSYVRHYKLWVSLFVMKMVHEIYNGATYFVCHLKYLILHFKHFNFLAASSECNVRFNLGIFRIYCTIEKLK